MDKITKKNKEYKKDKRKKNRTEKIDEKDRAQTYQFLPPSIPSEIDGKPRIQIICIG